ncbi:transposon Ty3-I Gag-Pol polyprotein [Trichonephila clavipes]|uniref:Transposon Ty3-I Gag-Pol polyprotein n=1 Tax=Trichonephila clavipes TaxID=2585209 RepID=A0A8X6W8X9_TRICX|nr:transposon Ty3-I Gag-Pol polyprotein [Trichonephila clavipes]
MLPFCPNDFDDNNITKIAARAEESRQLARVHTLRAQDKDRRRYDSKHQMVSYAPGDLVWVYTPVLRRLSAVTYEVQDFDPASRKRKLREVVHVLRMKPYHDPAEQIETEDIPPKESYKGPITRSRIKTLEQNDSGALSSFSRGAMEPPARTAPIPYPAPPPNLSRSSKEVHSSIKQTIRFILTLGARYNTGLRTCPTGDELCFYTLRNIREIPSICTLKKDLDSSRT